MANDTFRLGFSPEPQTTEDLPLCASAPCTADTTGLFIYEPVLLSGGTIVPALAGNSDAVTGVILVLRDSNGKEVNALPASASGTCEYTFSPNQIYRVRLSGTQFAGITDIGKYYNSTLETATLPSTTTLGDSVSARKLDGATENTGSRQFQVTGIAPDVFNNAAGATNIDLFVRIAVHSYAS